MDGVDHHPFKITVIGNGAALPAAGKYHSCQVLNVQGGLYLTERATLRRSISSGRYDCLSQDL